MPANEVSSTTIPSFVFTVPYGYKQSIDQRELRIYEKLEVLFYNADHELIQVGFAAEIPDDPSPNFQFTLTPTQANWNNLLGALGNPMNQTIDLFWSIRLRDGLMAGPKTFYESGLSSFSITFS